MYIISLLIVTQQEAVLFGSEAEEPDATRQ